MKEVVFELIIIICLTGWFLTISKDIVMLKEAVNEVKQMLQDKEKEIEQ